MIQFNLKEYLENPNRKVVTREGKPVRILCTDKKCEGCSVYPVVALIDFGYSELSAYFTEDGTYDSVPSGLDLFFKPVKKEGYIYIYQDELGNRYTSEIVYDTQEEAILGGCKDVLDTIKITWEE